MRVPRLAAPALLSAALLALVAAASPPVAAQEPTTITIEGHNTDTDYFFLVPGTTERNPPITVPQGAAVTIRFVNKGDIVHNVALDPPIDAGIPCCLPTGGEASFSFTAPTSDVTVTYFCTPHRSVGMLGDFVVGAGGKASEGVSLPDLGGFAPGSRGFGIVLAIVVAGAVALMFTRGARRTR